LNVYIGIDPGLSGGFAFLGSGPTTIWHLASMPVIKAKTEGKKTTRRMFDTQAVLKVFDEGIAAVTGGNETGEVHVCVERPPTVIAGKPISPSSVASMFHAVGVLTGIALARGYGFREVVAAAWKALVLKGIDKSKSNTVLYVKQRFPVTVSALEAVNADLRSGLADAACIAEYAARTMALTGEVAL